MIGVTEFLLYTLLDIDGYIIKITVITDFIMTGCEKEIGKWILHNKAKGEL